MKKNILILITLLSPLFMAGCSENDAESQIEIPSSEDPIELEMFTLTSEEEQVNTQTLDFSFRIFQQVCANDDSKNVVLSPLSAEMLLALVCNGASDETRQQMLQVLGFEGLDIDVLNRYNRLLLDKLPNIDNTTTLSLANGLWARQDFPFLPVYMETMDSVYDASVKNMDFNYPDAVCSEINHWCSDHTNGCIPKVLDSLSPDAVLILANALYFKGTWAEPFDESATREQDFTTPAGGKKKVMMMNDCSTMPYFKNEDFGAVTRSYGNGAFQMWLLLPHQGKDIDECVARLDDNAWYSLLHDGNQGRYEVNLKMPRFTVEYNRTLTDDLQQMGMTMPFSKSQAQFSFMTSKQVYLDFVKQFTYIKVEEKGTEAAAVTIGGLNEATSVGSEPQPFDFFLDRPFLFLITEYNTGSILFAGKITDPSAAS